MLWIEGATLQSIDYMHHLQVVSGITSSENNLSITSEIRVFCLRWQARERFVGNCYLMLGFPVKTVPWPTGAPVDEMISSQQSTFGVSNKEIMRPGLSCQRCPETFWSAQWWAIVSASLECQRGIIAAMIFQLGDMYMYNSTHLAGYSKQLRDRS